MKPGKLNNKDIVSFLKGTRFSGGLFDTLKIRFRTYICPFTDLIEKVQPGDHVGDVGFGSGQFLLLVSRFANQPQRLFGIEISDRLINNAKTIFSGYNQIESHFETFDGRSFPAGLGSSDIIFLIDVLHHVPKKSQRQFIGDLCKLMKPGARLVLKDINGSSPFVLFNKMHDLIFASEIGNEMSMTNVRSLLEQKGMRIVEQYKQHLYVYPHFTLVAQKD